MRYRETANGYWRFGMGSSGSGGRLYAAGGSDGPGPVSGVNYFFYLTTIISPYQRQLLFDSFRGARSARLRAEGGALLARLAKIVWEEKAGKADHHTFFFP